MIMSQMSTATGRLTWATSADPIARNTAGSPWPSATPTTMQSPTHSVR